MLGRPRCCLTQGAQAVDNESVKRKWRRVDESAGDVLKAACELPGEIQTAGTSGLPHGMQSMAGVNAYFVSAHTAPICAAQGVLVAGEMVAVRHDHDLSKAYNYAYATSSGGGAFIMGPFTDFSLHHMATTSGVPVASLFGHTPWKTTS